jgi:hypothetical protein
MPSLDDENTNEAKIENGYHGDTMPEVHHQDNSNGYGDSGVDHEAHGTGIKEDG